MRKYILIFGYTNFTEDETNYWNNLSLGLNKNNYELLILAPIKPEFNCHFFYGTFIEKLDDVSYGFFNANQIQDDLKFQKYLEREEIWYGESKKDRLTAAKFQFLRYSILLEELNPALVVLGNGEHAGELILKDLVLSRKAPLIYFERGCLPGTWHIDDKGITAGTTIASKNNFEFVYNSNDSFIKYKTHYLANKQTWWKQPKNNETISIRDRFGISSTTKIILFANQLDNDTSNFLYSPYFENNLEAFTWFCSELKEMDLDCFILIKKHPFFIDIEIEFQNSIDSHKLKGKWVDDISIFECLEQCDLFCAVNSTVVYESMFYEKPVLQLGNSILTNKEIVYEIQSINCNEIIKKWINKEDFTLKLENFKSFINYMIDKELTFFNKECLTLGFNNHDYFLNKILSKADENKIGTYPIKFVESRYNYEKLISKNLKVKNLFYLNIAVLKEIIGRIFKRTYRFIIH